MRQDTPFQQKRAGGARARRAIFWWSVSLGLLLLALNVAFFFLLAFSAAWGIHPDLGELASNEDPYLELKYLLLLSLVFLLVGLFLGKGLGKMEAVWWANSIACLIGSCGMVAVALIMVIFGLGAEAAGWLFISVVAAWPVLIGAEAVACVGGGALGGLIGSSFLHRRSVPDGQSLT